MAATESAPAHAAEEVTIKPALTEEVKAAAKEALERIVRLVRLPSEAEQSAVIGALTALVDAL